MDEFNELDKELARLRDQIATRDQATRQYNFVPEGDYWKRRLDEEKILMNKKLSAREEEKKALEAKLSQQQTHIDQYSQNIKDLEKKFDQESHQWEERLKAREMDLVIEKNRILSEEKLTKMEAENKRLLENIAEMNAKISDLKTEQSEEKKKFSEYFVQEREVYVEKMKAHLRHNEVLEARIKELESELARKIDEIEKVKNEYAAQLKESEARYKELMQRKESIEKEKANADTLNAQQKKQFDEDKRKLETGHQKEGLELVQSLRKSMGPLIGAIHLASTQVPVRSAWKVFKDIVQNLESDIEGYSQRSHLGFAMKEPPKVAALLSDEELFGLEKAIPNNRAELERYEGKDICREIEEKKPQALVTTVKRLADAQKVRSRYAFLPIIMLGEVPPKIAKVLRYRNFVLASPPLSEEETAELIAHTAYQSVARAEFWGQISVPRSKMLPIAAGSMALLCLILGYQFFSQNGVFSHLLASKVVSFATPYPQPTSVAFDGKNLWGCDWTGQSVFKHAVNGSLSIERIFYFPGKHFASLTWDGSTLWSMDTWEKKIYRHNMDENLTVTATYSAPSLSPAGLAGNGFWAGS